MSAIFLCCNLRTTSHVFKAFADSVKSSLGSRGVRIFNYHDGQPDSNAYALALDRIEGAQALVAILEEPSLEEGLQLQRAIDREIPILCLHCKGTIPPPYVAGAARLGVLAIATYEDRENALSLITEFLKRRVRSLV